MDIGNFRFYLYDQAERKARNLPAGYGIIMNQEEAFLSTSNYDDRELRQGTVIPIQLRREIGDDDILDLLKEYHDLTYLNWPAPTTTGKYPLVVTIAERFAELMRENISAESLLYLDF
jgi:argonaute-like protein implicated in RNA metabolism and viral defense